VCAQHRAPYIAAVFIRHTGQLSYQQALCALSVCCHGDDCRSREEWQALAVQDPAQVEGLVAEAVTAANTVM
jgi:hypothetical protein